MSSVVGLLHNELIYALYLVTFLRLWRHF